MSSSLTSPVCVTGASGWIGGALVAALVRRGYDVRAAVRDPSKPAAHLRRLASTTVSVNSAATSADDTSSLSALGSLSFVAIPDLMQSEGFREAVAGCRGLLHVANPMSAPGEVSGEEKMIAQSVAGVSHALAAAAAEPTLERVVLTATMASVCGSQRERDPDHLWTEADFNDAPSSSYSRAKTAAEQHAWELVRGKHAGKYTLATIHPAVVWGALEQEQAPSSTQAMLLRLVDGTDRDAGGVSPGMFGIVHIRDVIEAHIAALERPEAAGQRYLCSSRDQFSTLEVAHWLQADFPELGDTIAVTRRDPSAPLPQPKKPSTDNSKLCALLGVADLRPAREAARNAVQSFVEHGLVSKAE